jgi:HD superfamily phosphohydrolase
MAVCIPSSVYRITNDGIEINDDVYGPIEFSHDYKQYILHDYFVSKWDILQLGGVYYINSAANHNRWQHSCGTAHLTMLVINQIKKFINVTKDQEDALIIAALYHDIGHGPLSHVFESYLMPNINGDKRWKHENNSQLIIRDILKEKPDNFINMVCDIVEGKDDTDYWLYNIVACKKHGADTDLFDYLSRDMFKLNNNIDVLKLHRKILIENITIIDDKICFNNDNQVLVMLNQIYEYRKMNTKKYYINYEAKCIEYMLCDALKLEFEYDNEKKDYNIISSNPKKFISFTDSYLNSIENDKGKILIHNALNNINRYKCLCVIKRYNDKLLTDNKITYEDIFGDNDSLKEKIYILNFNIDFKTGNKNPLTIINFNNNGLIINLNNKEVKTYVSEAPLERLTYIIIKDSSITGIVRQEITQYIRKKGVKKYHLNFIL